MSLRTFPFPFIFCKMGWWSYCAPRRSVQMAQENPRGANPFDVRPWSLKTRTSTRSVFPEHHRFPEVPPDHLRGGRPRLRERDPVQNHGHQVRLLPCGAGPDAAGGGSEEHQAGPEDPGHHAAGTPGAHGESSRDGGAQQDRVPMTPGCPGPASALSC